MANFNGDNYAGEVATPVIPSPHKQLRVFYDTYTMTGNETSSGSDLISLFSVPAGYQVLTASMEWDDLGTGTATASLGVVGVDVDSLITAKDVDAAAGVAPVIDGIGVGVSTSAQVIAINLLGTSAVYTAGQTISATVLAVKLV